MKSPLFSMTAAQQEDKFLIPCLKKSWVLPLFLNVLPLAKYSSH